MIAGFTPPPGCWGTIGVGGDRSCPELAQVVHCRNCPVLMSAAEGLFERPSPEGYAEFWADNVARTAGATEATASVLIFRLGQEWLALDTALVSEVAETRPIHRVAHRSHTLLSGIVNIRGQLYLCVSLEGILEMPRDSVVRKTGGRRHERLVVIQAEGESWVFAAAEVHGVHSLARSSVGSPPASLPPPLLAVTRGIFPWEERRVGYLNGAPLVASFKRAIA